MIDVLNNDGDASCEDVISRLKEKIREVEQDHNITDLYRKISGDQDLAWKKLMIIEKERMGNAWTWRNWKYRLIRRYIMDGRHRPTGDQTLRMGPKVQALMEYVEGEAVQQVPHDETERISYTEQCIVDVQGRWQLIEPEKATAMAQWIRNTMAYVWNNQVSNSECCPPPVEESHLVEWKEPGLCAPEKDMGSGDLTRLLLTPSPHYKRCRFVRDGSRSTLFLL